MTIAEWRRDRLVPLLTAGLVALISLVAPAAHGQSAQWVRLSFGAGDGATSITVTWNTQAPLDLPLVRYGTTEAYGLEATGEPNGHLPDPLGFGYEATLFDLAPDTLYHYSVGTVGDWSEDATFMTAPADGASPLTFVVLGDCRSDLQGGANVKWHDILQEAWQHNPLFAVNTGDLVLDGTQPEEWADFLERTAFASPFLPQMPTIGNHDDDTMTGDAALYNRVFSLPRNTVTNTEDYYAFTTGGAVFAVLSSSTYFNDGFAAQAAWLDATLTAHQDKLWKFVFLHHPIYASHASLDVGFAEVQFNHPPNEQGQNAALVPVFDAHHVDMVFQGHNHYYERFLPLRGGGGNDEGFLANGYTDGTAYVISGGAGAFTYDQFDLFGLNIDFLGWLCENNPATGSAHCDGRHHYVVIQIVDNVLTLNAYSTTQQDVGRTETPERFDTITIQKDEVPPNPADDGGFGDGDGHPGDPWLVGDGQSPAGAPAGGCHCASTKNTALWHGGALLWLWSLTGLCGRRRRRAR